MQYVFKLLLKCLAGLVIIIIIIIIIISNRLYLKRVTLWPSKQITHSIQPQFRKKQLMINNVKRFSKVYKNHSRKLVFI